MEQCAIDVVRTAHDEYVHFGDRSSLDFDFDFDFDFDLDRDRDPFRLVDRSLEPDATAGRMDAMGRLLSWRMRHEGRTLTGHRLTRDGLVVRRDPRR